MGRPLLRDGVIIVLWHYVQFKPLIGPYTMKILETSLLALIAFSANSVIAGEQLAEQLSLINLPPGFEIHVYAEGVENARQLALGDQVGEI